MTPFWLSWYHPIKAGGFELNSPWWISGSRFEPEADTIVAAVKAVDEDDAWEIIRAAYDTPPEEIEKRFCKVLEAQEPFSERFPRADWMVWS